MEAASEPRRDIPPAARLMHQAVAEERSFARVVEDNAVALAVERSLAEDRENLDPQTLDEQLGARNGSRAPCTW